MTFSFRDKPVCQRALREDLQDVVIDQEILDSVKSCPICTSDYKIGDDAKKYEFNVYVLILCFETVFLVFKTSCDNAFFSLCISLYLKDLFAHFLLKQY